MKLRQLLFAALTRFLPAVAVIVGATLITEPLLRRHSVIETLRHVYLPLAVAEPLLISIGALGASWALRKHLDAGVLLSVGRNALAAVIAAFTLFVISIFSQGSHMAFIVAMNLVAGACGALVVFGRAEARPT